MINRTLSVPIGAVLLALLAPAASAQTPIRVGQSVNGVLQSGDPVLSQDNTLYDDYVLQATPGQRLVITLSSDAFDTFLVWGTGSGAGFQSAGSDDDSGGGTNSRLEVVVGPSGRHTIRANALAEGMSGRYTLSVQAAGGATVPTNRPTQTGGATAITAGQPVNGRLDASDPKLEDDSHYDLYVYRGRPGERIVVTMRSSDFDTYLAGGSLRGASFQQDTADDDGAGGTDSRIGATVGGDGTYAIRANSLAGGETGSYTLSVTSSQAAPAQGGAGGGALSVGQVVNGRLDSSDRRLQQDNSFYDQYVIRGQPGEAVLITMTSDAFDTYLFGGPGQGGQAQDSDDDGAGGTNARLQVNLDRSGVYTVNANSYGAGSTGAYTLSVERAAGSATPTAAGSTIALGQTVRGRLDSTDPRLSDNSHYDHYVFRGSPGQQVLITMASSDFDAYLTWGRLNGSQLVTEGNDDDSGGGTNAQLVATVPASGALVIQANSLGAGETGSYTVAVAAVGGGGAPTAPRNVPAGAATIAAGQSMNGTLARSDAMMGDSSFYDLYVYQGRPGDRLRISMQSGAFDTFLQWGRVDGTQFDVEAYDDDSGGGTNSTMEVTVGGTGVYAVRANSVFKHQTGAYTLRVERVAAGTPGPATPRPGTPRQTTGGPSTGGAGAKWRASYVSATNPAFRSLEQMAKRDQMLETFTNQLTAEFPLPESAAGVDLRMAQCNTINAFYSPRDRQVTFCYELMQHLARTFVPDNRWTPEQRERVAGAFRFIMMHEVGHALVHVRDLPITGREEDAVDQLATLMLVNASDKGAQEALAGVMALQPGENATFDDSDFADEHSLGPVRLYNVMCWIYGSDRQKNAYLVERGHLPRERAVRCPGEYEQLSKSWMRLLGRSQ